MIFKRKKTKQEQFLDELYWDSVILKEMITEHKRNRKTLLDLLRDTVRHTKPKIEYDWQASSAVFEDLSIFWCWLPLGGKYVASATYKGNKIPDDMAEDLYKLYKLIWDGGTEV
jgi:hypothetical protein